MNERWGLGMSFIVRVRAEELLILLMWIVLWAASLQHHSVCSLAAYSTSSLQAGGPQYEFYTGWQLAACRIVGWRPAARGRKYLYLRKS